MTKKVLGDAPPLEQHDTVKAMQVERVMQAHDDGFASEFRRFAYRLVETRPGFDVAVCHRFIEDTDENTWIKKTVERPRKRKPLQLSGREPAATRPLLPDPGPQPVRQSSNDLVGTREVERQSHAVFVQPVRDDSGERTRHVHAWNLEVLGRHEHMVEPRLLADAQYLTSVDPDRPLGRRINLGH